jgi:hypothetical protein
MMTVAAEEGMMNSPNIVEADSSAFQNTKDSD